MQVLRNFGRPFRAIFEDIVTDDDHRLSPKRTLRVRYGVQPGDEVKLQEIGGGEAFLLVNGKPTRRLPTQEALSRVSEIRTLQERIRQEN
jgi:hypothetical protein